MLNSIENFVLRLSKKMYPTGLKDSCRWLFDSSQLILSFFVPTLKMLPGYFYVCDWSQQYRVETFKIQNIYQSMF